MWHGFLKNRPLKCWCSHSFTWVCFLHKWNEKGISVVIEALAISKLFVLFYMYNFMELGHFLEIFSHLPHFSQKVCDCNGFYPGHTDMVLNFQCRNLDLNGSLLRCFSVLYCTGKSDILPHSLPSVLFLSFPLFLYYLCLIAPLFSVTVNTTQVETTFLSAWLAAGGGKLEWKMNVSW